MASLEIELTLGLNVQFTEYSNVSSSFLEQKIGELSVLKVICKYPLLPLRFIGREVGKLDSSIKEACTRLPPPPPPV